MKAMAKNGAKNFAYSLCWLLALPAWCCYRLLAPLIGKNEAFAAMSQAMSLWPGLPGNYLRWGFYRLTLAYMGRDAFICFGALLSHPDTRIGDGAYIGPQCNLGLCSIGADTLLGSGVHVISGFDQHAFDRLDIPIKDQGGRLEQIAIGQDCWIGNLAIIGAPVGDHALVGAGSTVTKAIPPYAIAIGQPAKPIRDRRAMRGMDTDSNPKDSFPPPPSGN